MTTRLNYLINRAIEARSPDPLEEQMFANWMARVDATIATKTGGLVSADLPDCCYRDWYQDGANAATAAHRAIRAAKEDF